MLKRIMHRGTLCTIYLQQWYFVGKRSGLNSGMWNSMAEFGFADSIHGDVHRSWRRREFPIWEQDRIVPAPSQASGVLTVNALAHKIEWYLSRGQQFKPSCFPFLQVWSYGCSEEDQTRGMLTADSDITSRIRGKIPWCNTVVSIASCQLVLVLSTELVAIWPVKYSSRYVSKDQTLQSSH